MAWRDHLRFLTPGERAVMAEMEAHGFMLDYWPERLDKFGVFTGSHGASASNLRRAIKGCMKCCDIYKYWRNDFGKGELSLPFVMRLCDEHLGGWKPRPKQLVEH